MKYYSFYFFIIQYYVDGHIKIVPWYIFSTLLVPTFKSPTTGSLFSVPMYKAMCCMKFSYYNLSINKYLFVKSAEAGVLMKLAKLSAL